MFSVKREKKKKKKTAAEEQRAGGGFFKRDKQTKTRDFFDKFRSRHATPRARARLQLLSAPKAKKLNGLFMCMFNV